MKKKLVSILLAVATVAGTCGAPAMAVFAEEGDVYKRQVKLSM